MKKILDPVVFEKVYKWNEWRPVTSSVVLSHVLQSRIEFSEQIGFPFFDLLKKGIGFFVHRTESEIIKPTALGLHPKSYFVYLEEPYDKFSKVTVHFQVHDTSTHELVARGEIDFMYVDMTKKKAAKMDASLLPFFSHNKSALLEPASIEEIQLHRDKIESMSSKIDTSSDEILIFQSRVADSDIDFYNHVNTAVYSDYVNQALIHHKLPIFKKSFFRYRSSLELNENFQVILKPIGEGLCGRIVDGSGNLKSDFVLR